MGPTNVALVKLFQADQKLREAQARLDATTKNVRIQERRVRDLGDRIAALQSKLKEQQAHAGTLDVDLKSRDAHIEKLRNQQQLAKNNKEYQAFLVEINTSKVDRNKVEEEAIKVMEGNEKLAAELKDLAVQIEGEQAKAAAMKSQITGQTAALQAEIDAIKPEREAAAQALPRQAREAFDRLADRFDGEAMSPLIKPDKRREEYSCSACMMDLVRDVYNKLHTRDELVFCPSCRRILYIPEDLPVEAAVHKPKERKERPQKAPPAGTNRQTSAVDVLRSVQAGTEESDETGGGAAVGRTEPAPRSGAVWTETAFLESVDQARQQTHRALIEKLRAVDAPVRVEFNAQGDAPSYNVYIDGFRRELLRVFPDDSYYVNWQGFSEANRPDLVDFCRTRFESFIKERDNVQGSMSAADRRIGDVNIDDLVATVSAVARHAAAEIGTTT